jgi:hypothetical protein
MPSFARRTGEAPVPTLARSHSSRSHTSPFARQLHTVEPAVDLLGLMSRLKVRERFGVEGGIDQSACVGQVCRQRCCEIHSRSPICGSFGMYARKNHKSLANVAFDDRGSAVRVFANDVAPSRKLGAILPINIQRVAGGERDFNGCLVDALKLVGIEVKPHAGGEIQTVVNRIAAEEAASTDSKVMQAVFRHGVPDIGCSGIRKVVANGNRVSTGDNEQLVGLQLGFGQGVELARVGSCVAELKRGQDSFDRGNVRGRSARPVVEKNRRT